MDIQTFSATYWYIWFLAVVLLVVLFVLNIMGFYLYHRKRQNFLKKSNEINKDIPLSEISNSTNHRSNSVLIINRTSTTSTSSFRRTRIRYPQSTIISSPKITPIPEVVENSIDRSSSYSNEKTDIDLSVEEFQRQALKEHNAIRYMHNKSPLKLNESLNLYAQYWAEQCAVMKKAIPSCMEWRLNCKGAPLGENIVSIKSTDILNGAHFTSLIMANGNQSYEVDCVLNEVSSEVGFGCAQTQSDDQTDQQQWIGVALYYPYHQLTTVQS